MTAIFARFFLLLTVLAMPFGMAGADALGAPSAHAGAMDMRHCTDHQGPAKAHQNATSECAMACAAALPAAPRTSDDRVPLVAGSRQLPANSARLDDRAPAIATPPPRIA